MLENSFLMEFPSCCHNAPKDNSSRFLPAHNCLGHLCLLAGFLLVLAARLAGLGFSGRRTGLPPCMVGEMTWAWSCKPVKYTKICISQSEKLALVRTERPVWAL